MSRILCLAGVLTGCLEVFGSLAAHAQSEPPYQIYQAESTQYGENAMPNNNGYGDTAFGGSAVSLNDFGIGNSGFGTDALVFNNEGDNNTGVGFQAIYGNLNAFDNTALGNQTLQNVTTSTVYNPDQYMYSFYPSGGGNLGVGSLAGSGTTTGGSNISIGNFAGYDNPGDGNYNIEIGNRGSSGDRGVIRIGTLADQGRFYAAGIYGIQITDAVPLYTNRDGQVGTVLSSIRFKEDVRDMASASDKLFQLRPVTYRYRQANEDGTKPIDYGLIAEEVAQIYPDMVARDTNGQVVTVQYQKLTPMLLNEVQKLHRQLEMQQETIEKLEARQKAAKILGQRLSALESLRAQPLLRIRWSHLRNGSRHSRRASRSRRDMRSAPAVCTARRCSHGGCRPVASAASVNRKRITLHV